MKNNLLSFREIGDMFTEKGKLCVSIIIPAHPVGHDRQTDHTELKKVIHEAVEHLRMNYSNAETDLLIHAIYNMFNHVDFTHETSGLGIFVSRNFSKLVHFYFPVSKKVIIRDHFEIRDLVFEMNYAAPYYFLELQQLHARLFQGELNHLVEVNDELFPKTYTDEYEYEHAIVETSAHGGSFTRSTGKDKSEMEEIREAQFYRQLDKSLGDYLADGTPIIVGAQQKSLAVFQSITGHKASVAGLLEHDYSEASFPVLENKVWELVKKATDVKKQRVLHDYEEKIGAGLGIEGLEEVWMAVMEGRGAELLVEKDYRKPGFVEVTDNSILHLVPPMHPHQTLPDAVEVIIETVLDKEGNVVFLENDALADRGHIALITRY